MITVNLPPHPKNKKKKTVIKNKTRAIKSAPLKTTTSLKSNTVANTVNYSRVRVLVLTISRKKSHPVFECDFISRYFLVLGTAVTCKNDEIKTENSKLHVNLTTVEKGLHFVDIRGGFQPLSREYLS